MRRCSYEACTRPATWWASGPFACDEHLAAVVRATGQPHTHLWRRNLDPVTALGALVQDKRVEPCAN